ncbi:hypothetical protein [Micromonospora sp. NPDC049282]|uniref:hypothetical protein n=1 Tax=Micromonospora sp. NPDC049282 TaxID=3364269 RepID=UPI003721153D
MAFRTWGRLLLTALGVSVLAGAGQLGIAYGFGVVRLDGTFVDGSVNRWPAQLVWVAWFAAVATVAGAVLTERLARRDDRPGGTTELLSIAGVSALGAIVVAPLCMQPARAAELGGSVDPVWAAGICAALGAVVGAGAAIGVLLKPPFGWGVALTAGIVWLLALLSVAPAIVSNRPLTTVRLGVLEPSWLDAGAAQRLAMLLLPTLALLAGGALGVLARRAGHPPLVGGAAGAAGPVLVAFAYLTAGPGTATDRYQLAPYYGALIAIVAGALGSTATTVLPRPATGTDAVDPTDILAPLPPGAPLPAGTSDPAAATATLATAGAPAPAHWDWPEAGGSATVPSTARHVVPAPPTAPGSPARPESSALARDGAGPAHGSPMPGLLTPGRRTSAIDVLAAGRPDPQPAAGATPADHDTPGPGIAAPAPTAAVAEPVAAASKPTGDTVQPTPDASPPTADASPPTGDAPGRPEPEPEPRAASGSPVTGTAPADTSSAAGATREAAPRATRPRRSRAAARVTPPTDEPSATDGSTSPTSAEPTPAGGSTPVPAGSRPATEWRDPEPGTKSDADGRRPHAADHAIDGPAPGVEAAGVPPVPGPPTTDTAADDPAGTARTARSRRTRAPRATRSDTDPAAAPRTDITRTPAEATGAGAPAPTPGGTPAPTTTGTPVPTTTGTPVPSGAGTPAPSGAGTQAPPAGGTDEPAESRAEKPAGGRRSFFFDPGPADRPATSPRPRFPIFEDVTERPGEVRPAWPITPAAGPPARPSGAAAPGAPATGRDGDDTTAPAEPAPRPRHQGLPEPGRSTGWDALATNARPGGRTAPDAAGPARATDAEPGATVPAQAGPGTSDTDAETARGRHAGADDAEAAGGKSKARRGLFRRSRGKGEPEQADEAVEPNATPDDEYVDWVAGLASDDNADDARSLRTGRHHRD